MKAGLTCSAADHGYGTTGRRSRPSFAAVRRPVRSGAVVRDGALGADRRTGNRRELGTLGPTEPRACADLVPRRALRGDRCRAGRGLAARRRLLGADRRGRGVRFVARARSGCFRWRRSTARRRVGQRPPARPNRRLPLRGRQGRTAGGAALALRRWGLATGWRSRWVGRLGVGGPRSRLHPLLARRRPVRRAAGAFQRLRGGPARVTACGRTPRPCP